MMTHCDTIADIIVIAEYFKYLRMCLLGTFKDVDHKIQFTPVVLNVKVSLHYSGQCDTYWTYMGYSSLCSSGNLYYFITIHKITPCARSANLLIKPQTFYARVMTQSNVEPARGCVTPAFIFL